jgi:hypothetical protein
MGNNMKITKTMLKQIIKEELEAILKDVETKEDAWAGGDNLENPIDYVKVLAGKKKKKK